MDRLKLPGASMHSAPMNRRARTDLKIFVGIVSLIVASTSLMAQETKTTQAFDQYVSTAERRITQERNSEFLRMSSLLSAQGGEFGDRLRRGEILIKKQGDGTKEIPGGLVHDWAGTVFIPNVSVEQVIKLVRDYNHTATHYSPEVIESRLMSENGDDLHVFMRLKKHKVITVVLDTEYDVHYGRIDAVHQYSVSRSTRVSEIEDPGTPQEHTLPAGHDHGFMRRLNSYWSLEQVPDGVIVQCEAISLTRDIPTGLAWMVGPFVNSIPRESLEFTLRATRAALAPTSSISQK